MGYFPLWRQFITNAIRVNILELLTVFSSEHRIMWMNHLPDLRNEIWLSLEVNVFACRDLVFQRKTLRFAKVLLSLLIFQIWVNDFHHARCGCSSVLFADVKEHHRTIM